MPNIIFMLQVIPLGLSSPLSFKQALVFRYTYYTLKCLYNILFIYLIFSASEWLPTMPELSDEISSCRWRTIPHRKSQISERSKCKIYLLSLFCHIFLWSCYLRVSHLTLVEWDGKLLPVTKRCQGRTYVVLLLFSNMTL